MSEGLGTRLLKTSSRGLYHYIIVLTLLFSFYTKLVYIILTYLYFHYPYASTHSQRLSQVCQVYMNS